ncbi:nucleotidyltransferase domain-containing protein [Guptibacillus sedimenti]|uniref:nucleotidyltransferase domain-containing protein n=1 Tax=Guptibacillus sedimenti TaxID=3025680 RepID=UPI0023617C21|nr:nucleotidyltransferase family protein [Pseudalkalibacillus sedimenti]
MLKTSTLKLDAIPKELQLIMKILESEDVRTELHFNPNLLREIDWEMFLKQTNHHRIYPLVYSKLKGISDKIIPLFVIESLSKQFKKNTFQMLHLSGEMERLSGLFFNKNVRSLYLKGPALAHDLYGDVSLRTSSDLDLLISINDLDLVEDLLTKDGYEKNDYFETTLSDWKWRHHHMTYFHPEKRIKVEVHWRLNPGPSKEPGFNELWERKRLSSLTRSPVYLLSKEDMFLFLASHGARHGWSRLRWLVDVRQLMGESIDWENTQKLFRHYYFTPIGEQTMILASQILNAKIPGQFPNFNAHSIKLAQQAVFYFENMVNLHTNPVPEHITKYHQRYLFSSMSYHQKILYLISLLLPYPEDVEVLKLPNALRFLYYPLRPVLWFWRKLKGLIPQRGQQYG